MESQVVMQEFREAAEDMCCQKCGREIHVGELYSREFSVSQTVMCMCQDCYDAMQDDAGE